MWKKMAIAVVGIGLGVLICKMASDRSKNNAKKVYSVKNEKLKKFDELLQNQVAVERLSGEELTKWFKSKETEFEIQENVNRIVAYPTKGIINGLGYENNDELDCKKSVIQMCYDTKKEEILTMRIISFNEIDNSLKEMLAEKEMIIVD